MFRAWRIIQQFMIAFKKRYAVATLLYCGVIFALSAQSEPPGTEWSFLDLPGIDKVAHAILYAGLAGVVSLGIWRSNESVRAPIRFWIPVLFALLYGLSDEIHQIYVPERSFDWMDLLADGVGATIVQVPLFAYLRPDAKHRGE